MEYQEILQEQFNNVVDEDSINSILSEAGDITGGLAQQFSAENILNATMEGRSIFDDPAIVENLKELFFLEIKSALLLCVEILSICIIIGVLKGCLLYTSDVYKRQSIGHVSPEAADGGVIGLIREGDIIDINIPEYSINARVSDEELKERKKSYVKPEPNVKSGWLARYSRLVSSANTGAVLK